MNAVADAGAVAVADAAVADAAVADAAVAVADAGAGEPPQLRTLKVAGWSRISESVIADFDT